MDKRVQAKHVPEDELLAFIGAVNASGDGFERWCIRWDIDARFSAYPSRVILAKLRSLMRRDLVDGCDCGCRGDFVLTDAGRAAVAKASGG